MDNHNALRDVRCSTCGRFFGKARIAEGEVYLYCGKCKNWTLLIGGQTEIKLTGEAILERLSREG